MFNGGFSIQYSGEAGTSRSCVNAVIRYLQCGDQIDKVSIISSGNSHALILHLAASEVVAIKSGFRSGYSGEGPASFAYVLELLNEFGIEIDEYEVGRNLLKRIDNARLRRSDLEGIFQSHPVRPIRWYDYLEAARKGSLWRRFPHVMPYSIIDSRIIDLAKDFWGAPGDRILSGYRRLEEAVRKRCNLEEHGAKLFSKAFLGEKSILFWPKLFAPEQAGRAQLFIAAFQGFRNRRAHKEIKESPDEQLSEFLLLNQLFRLEGIAEIRTESDMQTDGNNHSNMAGDVSEEAPF